MQVSTGGVNPLAAVTQLESQRVLTHRSTHATTTFDPVDLTGHTNVRVSVRLQVANTEYETGDGVSIFVTNGVEELTLFYEEALPPPGTDDFNTLAGLGFRAFSAFIPDEWTSAWLVIESSTNSTQGSERFDFDNIVFSGVVVPIPEPSTQALAWIASAASTAAVVRRRRTRSAS